MRYRSVTKSFYKYYILVYIYRMTMDISQFERNKGDQEYMETSHKLKTYVVHNPVSGTTDAEAARERIRQVMDEHQIPFEIYQTTGKEDVRDVVRAAIQSGFERFVAVGGDGTISAVASGLVQTGLPMVILPTGTVNALARELQIPIGLDDVEWWLGEHEIKVLDVLQAREQFYLLNISVGTSARIMNSARREDIHKYGVIVYIWEAVKRYATIPVYRFRLTIDGRKSSSRAAEILVANSGLFLGIKNLQLDEKAGLDSGKLSVCTAQLRTLFDYVRLAIKLFVQSSEDIDEFNCVQAAHDVVIEANRPVTVQGDGELIGNTPVTVKLIPRALGVYFDRFRWTVIDAAISADKLEEVGAPTRFITRSQLLLNWGQPLVVVVDI